MVNNTDIIELELNSKKFNLSLRKKEALVMEQQKQQMQVGQGPAFFRKAMHLAFSVHAQQMIVWRAR
eukprot:1156735-Pelagomonas_calceolata.AAC.4